MQNRIGYRTVAAIVTCVLFLLPFIFISHQSDCHSGAVFGAFCLILIGIHLLLAILFFSIKKKSWAIFHLKVIVILFGIGMFALMALS
jgi:hypothetical protein